MTTPFNPLNAMDYLPRRELERVQLERLRRIVGRAYERVPLFRERMKERGLAPEHIRVLDDAALLPFSVKADLRDTYPYGLLACPLNQVVRLHASSGTTGKPIVVAYTKDDIKVWSEVTARSLASCGLGADDIVQVSYGYGLFTGGLGAHYGAEALGATVIPTSGGNTERQIMVLKDFGVTAICCTPSYFLHLAERAVEAGVDFRALKLRCGVFGAEPWTEAMRDRIQELTGIRAFDIYGLSEIIGPGVAMECVAQAGPHIFEDHFLAEIIDPETGAVLPDGEEGELVLTTLSKDAMPMIRYRTRDITRLTSEPCACGRTLRRIHRIGRRSDDMFIVRGVNVFPSQIEAALLTVAGVAPHYFIVLTREDGLDRMEVQVEPLPDVLDDRVRTVEEFRRRVTHAIESVVGVKPRIRLMEPGAIPRSEGKARRVDDRRAL